MSDSLTFRIYLRGFLSVKRCPHLGKRIVASYLEMGPPSRVTRPRDLLPHALPDGHRPQWRAPLAMASAQAPPLEDLFLVVSSVLFGPACRPPRRRSSTALTRPPLDESALKSSTLNLDPWAPGAARAPPPAQPRLRHRRRPPSDSPLSCHDLLRLELNRERKTKDFVGRASAPGLHPRHGLPVYLLSA
jgi:hypothetical protein